MKKRISIFLAAAILFISGVSLMAADLIPFPFAFNGRWQPSEDPVLLDDNGLQDIQNLRKVGKHFKGVGGHTKINTTALSSYPFIINGYHFRKDQPAESHVIVLAADSSTPTATYLYQNTTAVPSAGDFSATTLHTDAAGGIGSGRFSSAPAGNMLYSNGVETLIWGGNEIECTSFITSTASLAGTSSVLTNPNDYSDQVRNTRQTSDQVAYVGGGIDSYTVLLLHGDGADGSTTITDSSAGAHTVTAADSTAVDTAQYKFSTGAILFDGNGDYVTSADSTDWDMADGAVTIDFWMRFNALPADGEAQIIFSQRADASNYAIFTLQNYGGTYGFKLALNTAGAVVYPINGLAWTTPAINTWYHIALIRGWGGAANSWTVCVNGVSLGATTLAATWPNVAAALTIGGGTSAITYVEPPAHSDTYVKATSKYTTDYWPYFATNPAKSLTDTWAANSWLTDAAVTNQRFHIDLGTATVVTKIYYENAHHLGANTNSGAKTFTFWGSNTAGSFADLTYATDTGWTQLTTSQGTFDEHAAADAADPKYITVTNTTAYRYYAFKFADNYGNATFIGVRRIGLNSLTTVNFNGWIDEFRISKGVARWTANFTVPAIAYRTAANYFLVGFMRPIQGVKFYIANGNTDSATLTAKEWNGSSWTSLSVTDNTSGLAQTGTVTFSSTVNTSKVKYISGLSLYWYQFAIDTGSATIYYCTVDAPMQSIKNIWNGRESYVSKAMKYDGTTYVYYTDEVNDDDPINTYADFSSLATGTDYILVGFTEPMQALNINFIAGSANSTASTTMTIHYWDGQAWTEVSALSDGTAESTTSFAKNGAISWQSPGQGVEFPRAISDEIPLYYYKLSFADTLDAEVQVGEIRGVMAPNIVPSYLFGETYRNRLFLFNEYNGAKNQAVYSQENSPDIFNGADSGYLYFGDGTKVVAAAQVYNVFRTFATDQLIVMKEFETYRLSGDSPETWQVQRMSANVGCVAPLSVVVCDAADAPAEEGVKRQVVIWQSDKGFVLSDGGTVLPISNDIRCYFDPNDSRYIPTARRSKTIAWYDSSTRSYKALISSGSSAISHNVELEYSLEYKEWTKVARYASTTADPLQSGFPVFDTTGNGYTYGGTKTGFLYRLENGSTFAGTNIEQYLQTKDLILDTQAPMFRKSIVKYMRTLLKKKTSGGTITIAHYGDQSATVDGTNNQQMPDSINMATAPYNTQSVLLGPFLYHSFKFTLSGSSIADGMELHGLGLWVEPVTAIR